MYYDNATGDIGYKVTNYTLHGKNIVHMSDGSNSLHFFYDAQNKPAVVIFNGTAYAYLYNLQGDVIQTGVENPPSDLDKNSDLRYDRKRFTEEWYRSGYNGPDSKSGVLVTVPWVRIPPTPPTKSSCFDTKHEDFFLHL